MAIVYHPLAPLHFKAIISLGNQVHGENYLDHDSLSHLYENSFVDDINASWVAIDSSYQSPSNHADHLSSFPCEQYTDGGLLVGFRLTQAATKWQIDKWCSPDNWGAQASKVCYFKCNTVAEQVRGKGVGKTLLNLSIEQAQKQGAQAGLAHIWLASPNNSAYGYFSACGGTLIKEHPNKWQHHSIEDGYECPVCEDICYCKAAEMILHFDPKQQMASS